MSRKIKHVFKWAVIGFVIAEFIVMVAILQGITFALSLFGGIIFLSAIAIIAALLIIKEGEI